MYFTQWDGMHLVFQLNNMLLKQVIIQKALPKRILQLLKGNLKCLDFLLTGAKKFLLVTQVFINGHSGFFKQLYNDGLVKLVDMPVNWCEELGTVLSNDEVIDGKSERGGFPVVRKNMKQWVMDIPKYAEILLKGLDEVDWPESTKDMQRNWIGKSVGAEVTFAVAMPESKITVMKIQTIENAVIQTSVASAENADKNNHPLTFTVFTTRPDTLFGATYCVLSPEHPLVKKITTSEHKQEVEDYIKKAASKSDLERTELNKEKTGAFTGAYAINPVNNTKIPIWISDYVLMTYGTGAIMAVPAMTKETTILQLSLD